MRDLNMYNCFESSMKVASNSTGKYAKDKAATQKARNYFKNDRYMAIFT